MCGFWNSSGHIVNDFCCSMLLHTLKLYTKKTTHAVCKMNDNILIHRRLIYQTVVCVNVTDKNYNTIIIMVLNIKKKCLWTPEHFNFKRDQHKIHMPSMFGRALEMTTHTHTHTITHWTLFGCKRLAFS